MKPDSSHAKSILTYVMNDKREEFCVTNSGLAFIRKSPFITCPKCGYIFYCSIECMKEDDLNHEREFGHKLT